MAILSELRAEYAAISEGEKLVAIGLTLAPVVVGTLNGLSANTRVYKKGVLKQPWFAPPGWLFPIAWTFLYACMGFASFLVYKHGGGFFTPASRVALGFYFGQLALNQTWTPTFFGRGDMAGGLWIIGGLWGLIIGTIVAFHVVSAVAAALLLPYLAWVSFASLVCYSVVHRNGPSFDAHKARKMK